MKPTARRCLQVALAAIVGIGILFANGERGSFVSQAEALIGRPLTPMSYAGVARRTTRRAYAAGAVGVYGAPVYGAPVVYGAPAYAPACYQVAGPYGAIVTRCP
jgi:hypothetical protein